MPEKPSIKEFLKSFGHQWLTKLSGPLTVPFTFASFLVPQTWLKILFAFLAIICALVSAYNVWAQERVAVRNLASRLTPKLFINKLISHCAETESRGFTLYVQIIPECLTEAPVYECRGHLLRVSKRSSDSGEWRETGMNFPLFLGWDCYGSEAFTIEPGVERRLNVCWWGKEEMFIIPAVDPLPSQHRTVFNSTGTFKFDIRLTARDCAPVDVSVTVNLDERIWNSPRLELIQGC